MVSGVLLGCPPPPDPDALPAGALTLPFNRSRADVLECKRNDCTDWYRIQAPEKGTVGIEIRLGENPPEGQAVTATLLEVSGRQLARAPAVATPAGRLEVRIRAEVAPGAHLFAVNANETRTRIDYRVSASFEPAPRPPRPAPRPPQFRKLSTAVLEVEGKRSVLLEAGAKDGMRAGQGGQLIENGKVIGEIVVTEVYNDGSRARIEGGLSGTITARTRAEISIPK
jgi:hypothetical protein